MDTVRAATLLETKKVTAMTNSLNLSTEIKTAQAGTIGDDQKSINEFSNTAAWSAMVGKPSLPLPVTEHGQDLTHPYLQIRTEIQGRPRTSDAHAKEQQ